MLVSELFCPDFNFLLSYKSSLCRFDWFYVVINESFTLFNNGYEIILDEASKNKCFIILFNS